jgi:peptide/nickel transport system substrate-binding protein
MFDWLKLEQRVISRRQFMAKAALTGAALPAVATLLAACGSDDDAATATVPAGGDGTPTSAATEPASEATATEAMDEATPTGEMAEPSPTSGMDEATPTAEGEAEATQSSGGTFVEGGDPLMGQEFEEGVPGGVLIDGDSCCVTAPFNLGGIDARSAAYDRLTFEPLVEPNPFTLEPVGCLAQAWEVSEDGLTWTFFLREGVLFHDGESFGAEDVEATYALSGDEASLSEFVTQIQENISTITVVDDLTIAFATPEVLPDFLFDAAMFGIGAAHILNEIDPAEYASSPASTGSDPAMVVGTGPFRASEVVVDDYLSLVRFDDYWGGAPYLDGWTFRIYFDDAALLTAVLAGEVDRVRFIQNVYVPELEAAGLNLLPWRGSYYDCIALNLDPEKTTLFQDPNVRKALMHALDREAMLQAGYEGFGEVANTLLSASGPFNNPDGVTVQYAYDPDLAQQLLDEAGWTVGANGIREQDGQPFAFSIRSESGWIPWENHAVTAQEYWRAIGLDVSVDLTTFDSVSEQYASGNFEATVWEFPSGPTPDRSSLFTCDAPSNGMGYCNPEVDAALTEARTTLDEEQRIALYTQFQNLVLEDLPMLLLVYYGAHSVSSPRVHNLPITDRLINYLFASEKIWMGES